jgi:iron(III) transport system substrate-binding protein
MSVRRHALLLAFVAVVFAPFALQALVTKTAPAPDANALELRIVTPHELDIRRSYAAAFSSWHEQRFGRSVRVVYLTPQGTNDMIRLLRDAYGTAGLRAQEPRPEEATVRVGIDLAWGGGDITFERELRPFLKPLALAADVLSAAFPERDLAGVPLYDLATPKPHWVGVALSSFGIVFNAELFAALGRAPPATWQDLAHPDLAGLVAMADPTRSGSAAVAYMIVLQRAMADEQLEAERMAEVTDQALTDTERDAAIARGYHAGLQTLTKIAANARYFSDAATRPCDDVGQGDAAAAMAIDFYARVLADEVGEDRVSYVAPVGATALAPDPIAVLYGTLGDREVLANRFVEFLLSPEGQRLWNLRREASPFLQRSLRRLPVRRDVYRDRTQWADDTDPFETAQGFNLRKDWMSLFRETRELWAAAWIDNHGALRQTYHDVLAVPDAARRADLLDRLSELPIEMAEVAASKARREALEQAGASSGADVRLLQAELRLSWAKRFAAHYLRVREAALTAGPQ